MLYLGHSHANQLIYIQSYHNYSPDAAVMSLHTKASHADNIIITSEDCNPNALNSFQRLKIEPSRCWAGKHLVRYRL